MGSALMHNYNGRGGREMKGRLCRKDSGGGQRGKLTFRLGEFVMRRHLVFSLVLTLFISTPIWAASVVLPQTGQTVCYDASRNIISCQNTRQDGALMSGVGWPVPRFVDNNNETISDKLTNMVWTKNADAPDAGLCAMPLAMKWQEALDYIGCLNSISYLAANDWALPNVNQLESLINFQQSQNSQWLTTAGFQNVQNANYWTSDTFIADPAKAWAISINDGVNARDNKLSSENHVWPVRIAPDFIVTYVGAPSTAATGQQVTIPVTYKNIGIGSTYQNVSLQIYLSTDNVITTSDTKLTGLMVSPLAPGAEATVNWPVTIPSVTSGTYYIGAIVDYNSTIPESNETNNALAASTATQIN